MRPKILVLTPGVFDKGGIARYGRFQIAALRDWLGEEQVEVVSIAGRGDADLERPFSVTWCGSADLTLRSRIAFCGAALNRLWRGRPDIVLNGHLHQAVLAASLARIGGALFAQNIYGRELWSGRRTLSKKALGRADLVISDCHNSSEYVMRQGWVRRPPRVVWDCVDLQRYTPGKADPATLGRYGVNVGDRFRILFLARLTAEATYKGLDRLLELTARLPADRFETVVAGKGDRIDHFRDLALKKGVADRTTFTGSIHEDDMPCVYRSADVFYLASEAGPGKGEGLPLTPLEAMACGAPVVVGNQDGSREIVESGGGLCVGPHDLEAQLAYIQRLEREPDFRRMESAAARRRVESAFGFPAFAARTVESFESLLADRDEA